MASTQNVQSTVALGNAHHHVNVTPAGWGPHYQETPWIAFHAPQQVGGGDGHASGGIAPLASGNVSATLNDGIQVDARHDCVTVEGAVGDGGNTNSAPLPSSTPSESPFLVTEEKAARSHTKKRVNHIARPPNSFILFRSHFMKLNAGSINRQIELSEDAGDAWHRLSKEEKQPFEKKAKEAKAEHKRLYPNYKYEPIKKKTTAGNGNKKKKAVSSLSRSLKNQALNTSTRSTPASSEAGSSPGPKTMALPPISKTVRKRGAQAPAGRQIASRASSASSSSYYPSTPESVGTPFYSPLSSPSLSSRRGGWSIASSPPTSPLAVAEEEGVAGFMPKVNIPKLDLAWNVPTFVHEPMVVDPSPVMPPAVFHPPLDMESVLPQPAEAENEDVFKQYKTPQTLPLVPEEIEVDTPEVHDCENVKVFFYNDAMPFQPTPVAASTPSFYLPHRSDEFSLFGTDAHMSGPAEYGHAASSNFLSTPYAFQGFELDAELDPVNRSVEVSNWNLDNMMNYKVPDMDLDKLAKEVFDFDFFGAPLAPKAKAF